MIILHPRPSAVVHIIEDVAGDNSPSFAAVPRPLALARRALRATIFSPSHDPRLASRSPDRARRNLPNVDAGRCSLQRGTRPFDSPVIRSRVLIHPRATLLERARAIRDRNASRRPFRDARWRRGDARRRARRVNRSIEFEILNIRATPFIPSWRRR